MAETKRAIDKMIMQRFEENRDDHNKIFEKLDDISKQLAKLCGSFEKINSDVYGNGKTGIITRVEKIEGTILKWGGAIAVILFLLGLFGSKLFGLLGRI